MLSIKRMVSSQGGITNCIFTMDDAWDTYTYAHTNRQIDVPTQLKLQILSVFSIQYQRKTNQAPFPPNPIKARQPPPSPTPRQHPHEQTQPTSPHSQQSPKKMSNICGECMEVRVCLPSSRQITPFVKRARKKDSKKKTTHFEYQGYFPPKPSLYLTP